MRHPSKRLRLGDNYDSNVCISSVAEATAEATTDFM